MDSASSRLRWAGNTLGIADFLGKGRYIGGLQGEGNDLSYMIKLLFPPTERGLTPSLAATIDSAAFDRPSKRRSARDQPHNHSAVDSVG
jgi:hypothetical protein